MKASVGDRLFIKAHRQGEAIRDAEVIEVLGPDGLPPFRVIWAEDGHETIIFPGSDAAIEHFAHGLAERADSGRAAGAHA